MIIAITGYKRSGKNTVSDYLKSKYGFTDYAFAKPIKEVASLIFGWSMDHIENSKELVDERFGISPRQFLQWMGTEAMQYNLPNHYPEMKEKVGRSIWVKIFEELYHCNPNTDYAISDFRFPHEEKALKNLGAYTIKVINPRIGNVDTHESEKHIDQFKCDYFIYNTDTFENLYSQVDEIITNILRTEKKES
jgi:hypothetical protein